MPRINEAFLLLSLSMIAKKNCLRNSIRHAGNFSPKNFPKVLDFVFFFYNGIVNF